MSRLRVHSFSIAIDGYGAGPNQYLENRLRVGGLNGDGPTAKLCTLTRPLPKEEESRWY
jgi:hypothetical protein